MLNQRSSLEIFKMRLFATIFISIVVLAVLFGTGDRYEVNQINGSERFRHYFCFISLSEKRRDNAVSTFLAGLPGSGEPSGGEWAKVGWSGLVRSGEYHSEISALLAKMNQVLAARALLKAMDVDSDVGNKFSKEFVDAWRSRDVLAADSLLRRLQALIDLSPKFHGT